MKAGRTLTAAMIVFALIVVPLAAYVGGYHGLATYIHVNQSPSRPNRPVVLRVYRQRWQANVFKPAATLDGWLADADVWVMCVDDLPG